MTLVSETVRCSVCRRYYMGRIPRGGDGSAINPRRHFINDASGKKKLCDGVHSAGLYLVEERGDGQADSESDQK